MTEGPDRGIDTVIAGGGAMGWSAAFWLTRLDAGHRVAVVEDDPGLARSATGLSVGSIRQQFSTPGNIAMSRFGIAFLRDLERWTGTDAAALGLAEHGYLLLAGSAEGAAALREGAALQRRFGAATEIWTPQRLVERLPWIDPEGVVLAAFGPRDEGWFDGPALHGALRRAARQAGALAHPGRVAALLCSGGRIGGVRLEDGTSLAAGAVLVAAGTGAPALMARAGWPIPVEPRKRTVYFIDAPDAPWRDAPLLVDPSGFYLRPEGMGWLAAIIPGSEDRPADPEDFAPDHADFEARLWPRLYARSRAFAAVKVLSAWAGHYDYNRLDQNALLGAVPGTAGLWLMAGFSGHGLQQAPAAGRYLAELILHGGPRSLDLSDFAPERVTAGRKVAERAVI